MFLCCFLLKIELKLFLYAILLLNVYSLFYATGERWRKWSLGETNVYQRFTSSNVGWRRRRRRGSKVNSFSFCLVWKEIKRWDSGFFPFVEKRVMFIKLRKEEEKLLMGQITVGNWKWFFYYFSLAFYFRPKSKRKKENIESGVNSVSVYWKVALNKAIWVTRLRDTQNYLVQFRRWTWTNPAYSINNYFNLIIFPPANRSRWPIKVDDFIPLSKLTSPQLEILKFYSSSFSPKVNYHLWQHWHENLIIIHDFFRLTKMFFSVHSVVPIDDDVFLCCRLYVIYVYGFVRL